MDCCNRRQCVVLNRKYLVSKMLRAVFLKDQSLHGTLFLVYVNDLPMSLSSHVFLLADNTKLKLSISQLVDLVQLQADLDNLTK